MSFRSWPATLCCCAALAAACSGCASDASTHAASPESRGEQHQLVDDAPRLAAEGRYLFQARTASPAPEAHSVSSCAVPDAALEAVAARLAHRHLAGLPEIEPAELSFALRAEGSPYVWPRAWLLSGEITDAEALSRLGRFLESTRELGEQRCGVARVETFGQSSVLAAVSADVLADLQAVPTVARLGQWIRVEARLLVPASQAKLVALGPRGLPRPVPTSLSNGLARAAVSLDQRGAWLLQLLADTERGPRPLLEAMVFVDGEPPESFIEMPAPGEEEGNVAADEAEALARMMNAARREEGLLPLRRAPELDAVADGQARAMRDARLLAHDIGAGDPVDRLRSANVGARAAGENVAHAGTVLRGHRALWQSPSHRGNLLHSAYDAVGVGIAQDVDGSVWICAIFADFGSAGIGQSAPHAND